MQRVFIRFTKFPGLKFLQISNLIIFDSVPNESTRHYYSYSTSISTLESAPSIFSGSQLPMYLFMPCLYNHIHDMKYSLGLYSLYSGTVFTFGSVGRTRCHNSKVPIDFSIQEQLSTLSKSNHLRITIPVLSSFLFRPLVLFIVSIA